MTQKDNQPDLITRLEALPRKRDKKQEVKNYVLELANSTDKGSILIHKDLVNQFPQGSSLQRFLVNRSTIERWINPPFELEKVKEDKPQLYP